MLSGARLILVLLLACSLLVVTQSGALQTSPTPINSRNFYFAPLGTLSTSAPTGTTPSTSNLTLSPSFAFPTTLLSPATIGSQVKFSLWTDLEGTNNSLTPTISASFDYKYAAQQGWTNLTSTSQQITRGPSHVDIAFNIAPPPLPEGTSIAVGISAKSVPRHDNVTLNWGSSIENSLVGLQLSGYETLVQTNPVAILDRTDVATTFFPINAGPGNNIVLIKTLVTSALGFGDIRAVNMTIVDPSPRPVKQASNLTMLPPGDRSTQPFQFIASWVYPSNSSQGTYQVWIDIIDAQGDLAYSYRGPTSFGLVPPGFIPPPYNLVPYFLIGGVAGVSGGAFYYRRKKRKSYLAPFDHFNTLTGGGLEGGTVVTIEGNTGSGKTLLSEQLMYEDLRNGRPCVFVSTSDFPNNIRTKMKTMGFDVSGYEQSGLLAFVDCYSAEAGQESQEKVSVPALGDLTTLGVKISSTLPSNSFKGGGLYFDSLSPLASKAKPDSLVSFVQSVGARVRGLSGKAFFTVGQGIHESIQRQLQENADCIVQMEAFEESGTRKRRLRISKLRARTHQEGWTEFTIEDGKGIIFYSGKSKK